METFKNIRKGIITTLFGLIVLGVTVHQYLTTGEVHYQEAIAALIGIGLLISPDPKVNKK